RVRRLRGPEFAAGHPERLRRAARLAFDEPGIPVRAGPGRRGRDAGGRAADQRPGAEPAEGAAQRGCDAAGAVRAYLPVNGPGRFSTKCATPSLKSSLFRLRAISRSASTMASFRSWTRPFQSWRLITPMERGDTASASSRA